MEVASLFVGIALLIVLAVTSLRYGVDSREGIRSRRGELAAGGIVWDVPDAMRNPATPARKPANRPAHPAGDCAAAPCAS